MLYSIVALLVVILDQAVKFWVTNNLMGYDVVSLIPGVVSLVNVPNYGAAFGILSGGNARIGFIIVTVIFCLAVMVALATNFINGRFARWCLVMVAAGGFANCIDRVMYGYVVDMFKIELFNFFIFNVADIFITVFAILFAVAILFEKDSTAEDEDEEEEEEEEDDEEKPRKGLLARFRHDDEEEEEKPRRGKKAKYEDEYEEYRSKQRPGRPAAPAAAPRAAAKPGERAQSSAPARSAAPARSSDPFAEWEKANARVDAQRSGSYAARAMGAQPQQRSSTQNPQSAQPQQGGYRPPVQRPAQQARPVQPAYNQEAQAPYSPPVRTQAPAQSSAPQQAPRPQAQPEKSSDSEFDLDDILNEFK